jgi:hypothetical protein
MGDRESRGGRGGAVARLDPSSTRQASRSSSCHVYCNVPVCLRLAYRIGCRGCESCGIGGSKADDAGDGAITDFPAGLLT